MATIASAKALWGEQALQDRDAGHDQGRRLLPSYRACRFGEGRRQLRPAPARHVLSETPGRRGLRRVLGPGARSRRRAAAGQRPELRHERHGEAGPSQRPASKFGAAGRQSPAAVPAEGGPARSLRRSRQGRRARHVQQVDRVPLQNAGPHPRLGVVARPRLKDDAVDTLPLREAGRHQPRRPCGDDPRLRALLFDPWPRSPAAGSGAVPRASRPVTDAGAAPSP